MRRRLLIVLAMSVALIGCGSQVQHDPEQLLAAPVVAVVPETTTTSTTLAPPPPPPPPAPSAPAVPRAPRPPRAAPQIPVVGRLIIPRLGLDTTLYEGDSLSVIDHGPGHLPWTAMPGEAGNVSVAGHRVTHSHPFRHLDTLELGDTLTFEVPSGSYTYEFVGHEIITPDRVDVTAQTPDYRATLVACHPPGSAKYRIVAHWKLISPPAPGQPAL